ncbi:hypothetical protein PH7735_00354 [Shimia thalassica]|uniref:Uncharacterized protein n=1 Tax=Shimia thalassica TaxID=1715693 RepID=A0A0P1I1C0_9RHOB|nr:hypothetical protein PH7735_00354 [Shimia thalassica]
MNCRHCHAFTRADTICPSCADVDSALSTAVQTANLVLQAHHNQALRRAAQAER